MRGKRVKALRSRFRAGEFRRRFRLGSIFRRVKKEYKRGLL